LALNPLEPKTRRRFTLTLTLTLGVILSVSACAKKEPKPLRTEPWLAHPPASAALDGGDAAVPAVRYALTEQSRIRFEISGARGSLRGSLTRVSGEVSVVLSDISQSRGQVRVDLNSLSFDGSEATAAAARARSALELSDAGAAANAIFDLRELRDVSPALIEPAPESHADGSFTRHARATAVGELLLHGFRVLRRAPLEAEFGFAGDRSTPSTLLIRSRAPFVVSLDTHAIRAIRPEGARKPKLKAAVLVDEVSVSVELYATKRE
jgi:hypothetical protein